jgi:uncharacterized protein YndB with AHSA1/START domain
MSDRIEKSVELEAPVERVWRALTDHEEFGAWFRVKLDGPFAVGEITTGRMTYPGHEGAVWTSLTQAMDPPRLFAFRWGHPADPQVETDLEPSTLVEFHLEPTSRGTRLTVVESGFERLPPDRRLEALRGNEAGWTIQTQKIRDHVAR